MINVGILGAGGIAHVMADTINRMNEAGDHTAKLYAVASRDIIKSEIFANQNNVEKFYGSYEEMLEDPNVDLVYVATPHSHHYEHMKLVLEHDKNILCEKAFTVNAHQAREIFEIAEKKGLVVAEAIWTRYQPMREMINEQVFSGKIGQPKMLTANLAYDIDEVQRLYDPKLAGGALLDVGVYTLNFAEMIFGPADNIQANCIKTVTDVDETDCILLSYDDGRRAVLTASTIAISDRYGIIYGTEGFIRVENINNPQKISIFNSKYECVEEIDAPKQLTGYEYEVREVCNAIENGLKECPSMKHEDTIHMLEVMDSIRRQFFVVYPFE